MASTWSFINQKGGAGKTTLLIHLAIAAIAQRRLVAVLDLDPQRSAEQWAEMRADLRQTQDPPIVASTIVDFKTKLKVAESEHDLVLVDTPGTLDKITVGAASVATTIVIPTRTNSFDRDSLRETLEFLDDIQALDKTLVVLNAARNDKVRKQVAHVAQGEFGVHVIASELANQVALAAALEHGKGISEASPGSKAANAIGKILDDIDSFEQRRSKAASAA